jgi:hypothetical protein
MSLGEQAEGYGKAREKSTSRVLSLREGCEYGASSDEGRGKRLKVRLEVLFSVQSGEPPGTRTQGPRLKRGNPQPRRNLSRRARRERTGRYRVICCARQELNLRPAGSKGNGHHRSNLIIPTKPYRYEVPVHPVFGVSWGHSSLVHGQNTDSEKSRQDSSFALFRHTPLP